MRDRFDLQLLAERREIWAALEVGAFAPCDDQERGTEDTAESEYSQRLVLCHRLDRVQAALARITAGIFGHCIVCGDRIGTQVLEEDPADPFCTACRRPTERTALSPRS